MNKPQKIALRSCKKVVMLRFTACVALGSLVWIGTHSYHPAKSSIIRRQVNGKRHSQTDDGEATDSTKTFRNTPYVVHVVPCRFCSAPIYHVYHVSYVSYESLHIQYTFFLYIYIIYAISVMCKSGWNIQLLDDPTSPAKRKGDFITCMCVITYFV